jgi:hypothetical protein
VNGVTRACIDVAVAAAVWAAAVAESIVVDHRKQKKMFLCRDSGRREGANFFAHTQHAQKTQNGEYLP